MYDTMEKAETDSQTHDFQRKNDKNNDSNPDNPSNSKKHEELLKCSDEILRKLEEVRRTKAYEMMKYETIARMNAASVSAYLRQERLKPTEVKLSPMDEILQVHNEETKNQAAIAIQQFFREMIRQKEVERLLYSWKWIPLEKRLQYIEAIAERMSDGTVPRKIDLSAIKDKLEKHKKAMHEEAEKFVRREELVKSIERDLKLLNDITNIDDLIATRPNNFSTRNTG